MKKTILAALAVSMLAGCGVPTGLYSPRQAELQSISAQSKTSFKDLTSGIQAFFKSQVKLGKLSKDQYAAEPVSRLATYYHTQVANSFINLDANGDMELTPDELTDTNGLVPFADADHNKNGRVTFSEYEEAVASAIAKGKIVPTLPTPPAPPAPTPATGSVNPAPAASGSNQPTPPAHAASWL